MSLLNYKKLHITIVIFILVLGMTFGLLYKTNFVSAADDDYHIAVREQLLNQYGISGGSWVLTDNEETNIIAWGGTGFNMTSTVTGMMFEHTFLAYSNATQTNHWDLSVNQLCVNQINVDDICLVTFWARVKTSATGAGLSHVLVEKLETWDKSLYKSIDISINWQQYFIPFKSLYLHDATSHFQFNVGHQEQLLEFGGANILNFGSTYTLTELEAKFLTYSGRELDASWRTAATDRINHYRKANLQVNVKSVEGTLIPGATVSIEMIKPEFVLGTAVAKSTYNNWATYRQRILDLDGKGHGFGGVVCENEMKWPDWENAGESGQATTITLLNTLMNAGLELRGHNLVWPANQWLPSDIQSSTDVTYIQNRIQARIADIVADPAFKGKVIDWDVINEPVHCTDLKTKFNATGLYGIGENEYIDWFRWAREADPDINLFYNEYNIVASGGADLSAQNEYKRLIQIMVNEGLLDGIGIQGHMATSLTSPERVISILEDFSQFDKTLEITEYDATGLTGDLAYDYTRDFLTAVFSVPQVRAFYVWGFWDSRHWKNDAPFFYANWTVKPAGQAIFDLMFDEWWTNETGITNSAGIYVAPNKVFKGTYTINVTQAGVTTSQNVTVSDDTTVTIEIDIGEVDTTPPAAPQGLVISPISSKKISLDWIDNSENDIKFYNVYRGTTSGFTPSTSNLIALTIMSAYIDTGLPAGTTYYYRVTALDDWINESPYSSVVSGTTLPTDTTPPLAPTGVIAIAESYKKISLTWTANSELDFVYYKIYRSIISGFSPSSSTLLTSITTSSYLDNKISPETTYYYRIAAVDDCENEGLGSTQVSATTPEIPPAFLRAQYLCSSTATSTNNIGFNLYIYNDGSEGALYSEMVARYWFDSEYSISTLANSIYYAAMGSSYITSTFGTEGDYDYLELTFSLTTSLSGGSNTGVIQNNIHTSAWETLDQSNDYSFNPSVTTLTDWERITIYYAGQLVWGTEPGEEDITAPAVPTGLTTTTSSSSQIDLDWTDNSESDLAKYCVYRSTVSVFTPSSSTLIAEVISSTYSDTGLTTSTTYYYIITAVDTSGNESPASSQAIATTQEATTGAPDVNNDGIVDIIDALLIAQYYVDNEPDNFDPTYADCNNDGTIDIVDALLVAQYYVGAIPQWW